MSGPPAERDRDSQPADRLTDIADIGRARQQWLNDLGIYTFSDLADSSAEDLANQLQAAEHSVKLAMVQQWIEQARALAEEQDWERWHQHRDPFTDLEGIDTAKQQWIYSLEIYTFSDLAASSAEDVEQRLRAAEHLATADEIQQWIDQSRSFVEDQSETSSSDIPEEVKQDNNTADTDASIAPSLAVEGTSSASPESEHTEAPSLERPPDTDWQSLTSFIVTYQTRQISSNTEAQIQVHHRETDRQQTWPIEEIEQLAPWLLARIEELPPPSPLTVSETRQAPAHKAVLPKPVRLEQLRFLQSPQLQYVIDAKYPTQMVGPIQGNQPFMSEVYLSLNREGLDNPDDVLSLQVQAFISNRITGNSFSINSSHSVSYQEAQPTFKVDLPETILEMGIYRFQLIVSLENVMGTSDVLEVPALQVT